MDFHFYLLLFGRFLSNTYHFNAWCMEIGNISIMLNNLILRMMLSNKS